MSSGHNYIAAVHQIAHNPQFLASLTPNELTWLLWDLGPWLRPEQIIPRRGIRSFGIIGGRGLGKSLAVAYELNRRVEAGECVAPALMAPNEDRVKEVQADFLVNTSPPWFRAEHYEGGVRWPNGVTAVAYTPIAPGRSRSGNHDVSWLCEIVDWKPSTRLEAFHNITTATRTGAAAFFWDTTSRGRNDVIRELRAAHARDPRTNVIRRGSTFDNPLLSRQYLAEELAKYGIGSRRADEELFGRVFDESAGALWLSEWIESGRVGAGPVGKEVDLEILALDPALAEGADNDETGLIVARRGRDGHAYITEDLSGKYGHEVWANRVLDRCEATAAGVVYEGNHAGDMPITLLNVMAAQRGLRVRTIPDDADPFPRRQPGVVFVRKRTSRADKAARAETPAGLYRMKRVHHVGTLPKLEEELTTWEPEAGAKSPNRLDALVYVVAELCDVRSTHKRSTDACTATARLVTPTARSRGAGVSGLLISPSRRLG